MGKTGIDGQGPVTPTSRDDADITVNGLIVTAQRLTEGDQLKLIFSLHHAILRDHLGKDFIVPGHRGRVAGNGPASPGTFTRF